MYICTCTFFYPVLPTGGIDYTELSAVITLSATASEDCVSIGVVDDSVLEETEFLTVTLSLIRELNSVQLTEHTATILITDDDGKWDYVTTCRWMHTSGLAYVGCRLTFELRTIDRAGFTFVQHAPCMRKRLVI